MTSYESINEVNKRYSDSWHKSGTNPQLQWVKNEQFKWTTIN